MDINHLAIDIQEWADSVFPDRTDASMFLKMYGELAELIEAGDACDGEIADILILILDYARRKGVNPSIAVQMKLRENKKRKWEFTPIGTMQHVE
jgi:NTP pyrophosphatase (non-canonical NTP hydrolase)